MPPRVKPSEQDPELRRVLRAMENLVFKLPVQYRKRAVDAMRGALLDVLAKYWERVPNRADELLEEFGRESEGRNW